MHYNEVYLLYASLPQTMFHLSSLTRIADPHHLLKCIYWDKPQASQSQHEVLLAQSCLTLCDPMDCSPPGSCVHGIFQARTVEWVAISFSRIFPTQGLNLGLLHCSQILYHLSHQGILKA